MTTHYINAAISQEQVDAVLAALKTIDEAVPGLVELTSEQRKAMIRYSEKNLGFILKALNIAEQHPEILPASFNIDIMRRDIDVLQKTDLLLHAVTNTLGKIQDTHYAAGSESEGHVHSIYKFVKNHNTLTGELEDTVAELGKQFMHKSAKSSKPEDA